MAPTAIVIGASSGIGLEIARLLNTRGYRLGLAARRIELLRQHARSLSGVATVRALDLLEPEVARTILQELFQELGQVDFLYISSGTGYPNLEMDWPPEDETIRVNSLGFAAVASAGFVHFVQQGHGHIVGITSVAALRGSAGAPAYNASKAFAARYLEGLRYRAARLGKPIYITEACPGFVDTAMMKAERPFWVATAAEAARHILRAAEKRRSFAFITPRWRLVAWLQRLLPDWVYTRVA